MTALGAPELAVDDVVVVDRPAPHPTEPHRVGWLDRSLSMWWIAGAFSLLALIVVLTAQPNHYVVDNLFAWFWRPTAVLRSWQSPWDPQGGLGAARPDFSPVFVGTVAVIRALGASAPIAERLVHAGLLLIAGLGAIQAVRLFIPRVRALHVFVGLLYMFNPYSATYVVPSALFLNYALAPWFVYVVVRGVRDGRRGRAAAWFALLVFGAGLSNVPGLGWALLPVVPALLYVVYVERAARLRDVGVFVGAAFLLTILVMAAGIVKLRLGAPRLAENLNNTETLGVVSIASSWSESFRGLGFWLSYWSDAHGLAIAQTKSLMTSPFLVGATFAWPIGALASLPRLALAAATVVRGNDGAHAGRNGRRVPVRAPDALRPLPAVGLRLLPEPVRVPQFLQSRRRAHARPRRSARTGPGRAAAPEPDPTAAGDRRRCGRGGVRRRHLPVLDRRPLRPGRRHEAGRGPVVLPRRVLLARRASRQHACPRPARHREHLVPVGIRRRRHRRCVHEPRLRRPRLLPTSNAEANSIITGLDDRVNDGTLEPGMIGPIARELGVRYVMLRNDLDWKRSERPRPAQLDVVRNDPDLSLAATFGAPGQNVTDPSDSSPDARIERTLPPVQIYEVAGTTDPPRAVPNRGSLLLAGDGAAWPLLARNGDLEDSTAVISTRDLTAPELQDQLENDASVVVSDTNRRVTTFVTQTNQESSYTLARTDTPERGLTTTAGPPDAQTVATFSDALDVREISPTSRSEPDSRPALAFDGDPATAWLTDAFAPADARLHIDLRAPHVVSHVDLLAARPLGLGRNLTGVDIRFSDGSSFPVGLQNGSASITFSPRRVSWIEIVIAQVAGPGVRPIGLAEVGFNGLTMREASTLPEDIFHIAARNPATNALLERAPISYQFERQRTSTADIEARLSRSFLTVGDRAFTASGTLELDPSVSDAIVAQTLGGPSGAIASARYGNTLANSGTNAFDGNIATGWVAPAQSGVALTLRFGAQSVQEVTVLARSGPALSRPTNVRVEIGSTRQDVALVPEPSCSAAGRAGNASCELVGEVAVPPTVATGARVVITDFEARAGGVFGAAPLRIDEVELNGTPNVVTTGVGALGGCIDNLVWVDGHSMPVALGGTRGELLSGQAVPYTSCGTVTLITGMHSLRTSAPVDDTTLTATAQRVDVTATEPTAVSVVHRSASSATLQVTATAGDLLVGGISSDGNWKATVDGHSLGRPESVNGQSAWRLPQSLSDASVHLTYVPQRRYDIALFVTAAGLALCGLVLVMTRRRRSS